MSDLELILGAHGALLAERRPEGERQIRTEIRISNRRAEGGSHARTDPARRGEQTGGDHATPEEAPRPSDTPANLDWSAVIRTGGVSVVMASSRKRARDSATLQEVTPAARAARRACACALTTWCSCRDRCVGVGGWWRVVGCRFDCRAADRLGTCRSACERGRVAANEGSGERARGRRGSSGGVGRLVVWVWLVCRRRSVCGGVGGRSLAGSPSPIGRGSVTADHADDSRRDAETR